MVGGTTTYLYTYYTMNIYNFYLFMCTFRFRRVFIFYQYIAILAYHIYWVPYYLFSFLFYNYIVLRDRDFYFSLYTLYIDVILICFLLSFLVFKFLVFKNLALFYFHFKKVYINGNIARILVNLAPYGIYKIKPIKWGVIYVFSLLLADFNCCMGFCFMFLLVVFIVIIFNFLIRFTLYNLRAFSPLFYIINHSLIRFIFYLGMFKLLLINSFSETDYLFSGFSYISQDIILVTVKNLIIFVFIYFNLFDPNLGYIFASVLPGSYYFFYRNILLYYKNLCSTIVYNGCLMDCGFMSVFKCRFVYNYQFSRFSNRVIAIHRDLDSYINWGNSPNILNKINTSNSYFKNFYVCNPLNQNNFIVESRCNFLNGFYNHSSYPFSYNTLFKRGFSDFYMGDGYSVSGVSYGWQTYRSLKFYNGIDPSIVEKELRNFLKYYKSNYLNPPYFAIILKIDFGSGGVRSASFAQISSTDPKSFKPLLEHFVKIFLYTDLWEKMSETEEHFTEEGLPIGNVLFSFKPLKTIKTEMYSDISEKYNPKPKYPDKPLNLISKFKFKNYSFPSTMNLKLWPGLISEGYNSVSTITIDSKNTLNLFIVSNSTFSLNIIKAKINNDYVLQIQDKLIQKSPEKFERVIWEYKNNKFCNPHRFIFYNNNVIFSEKVVRVNYIEGIKKSPFKEKINILTLDFETCVIGGKHIPICISIYDLNLKKSFTKVFYSKTNWELELRGFLKEVLLRRKYDGYKVYAHNFFNFDYIFLLDSLSYFGGIKLLDRNDKILKFTLCYNLGQSSGNNKNRATKDRKFYLHFLDSFLIMPNSLASLSKSFSIENKKLLFPINLLNELKEDWFKYEGEVPSKEWFRDISCEEYTGYCSNYVNKKWNIVDELIKYCERDCIALAQIIEVFYRKIHSILHIDSTKYPTLPSITFAGYRSSFLPEKTIPIIEGSVYQKIKNSYYGGITESYKPHGYNIYSYDVNSLYPFAMNNFYYPTGAPIVFTGEIDLSKFKYLGFFRVKVFSPDNIDKPTLPKRLNTGDGLRTIFPTGEWEGWYFSEELKDKLQDGYKFQVIEGVYFKRKTKLFNQFIDGLYKLKQSTKSSDPLYFISKMLMNALYGRFGLNPSRSVTRIVTADDSEEILKHHKNIEIKSILLSGKVVITYEEKGDNDSMYKLNMSIGIASAISAYSRVIMASYIRKYNANILSIDTDGIKVDTKLDMDLIDEKELGKMKYEYNLLEGVFPIPKVYGGLLTKPYRSYESELVKIKGIKNPVPYFYLKMILNKYKSLNINEDRWFKRLDLSTILVKNIHINISLNENKRRAVYNSWGDLVNTLPLNIKNDLINAEIYTPILHYIQAPKSYNFKRLR